MADDERIEAPITAVTVFRDGARVVRRGTIELGPGSPVVVIGDLPSTVGPESVRVLARGQHLALLEVEVRSGVRTEPLREDAAKLREEVERCRDAVGGLDDEDAAEQARLGYYGHLSESVAGSLARAVGAGRIDRSELGRMAEELAAGTSAALQRRRQIEGRRRAARQELEVAEEKLAGAELVGRPVPFLDVAVALEVTARTECELELSYHVASASWQPLYDLRIEGESLAVSFLAEVTQRSGEDWPPADLVLSTVRRGRHRTIPELGPWYIGRPVAPFPTAVGAAPAPQRAGDGTLQPPPPAGGLAAELSARPETQTTARVPFEPAPLIAEAAESGVALVYRVPRPMEVPSDGAPHKTTVARFDLDAALDYVTVPALVPEAYLRATVTNATELLLLPGPANVFHDSEYVGASSVGTVAPGEELEVQLGVDDRIRIERELRRRSTSKAVLGGTRTIDIVYELSVENHRPEPARIRVHDHVPVSRDGDIKVRLRQADPKPVEHDDLGRLSWDLTLQPGETSTVAFGFAVEHPSNASVVGL